LRSDPANESLNGATTSSDADFEALRHAWGQLPPAVKAAMGVLLRASEGVGQ
jgi:hypothetical protein